MTATTFPVLPDVTTRVTGRRVVQYVLDVFLAGIALGLLGLLANAVVPGAEFTRVPGGFGSIDGLTAPGGWTSALGVLLTVLVWLVVFVVVPVRYGRTPAMMVTGLHIVRLDGGAPSVGQHAGRAVLLVVDTILGGLVGLIVILCSSRRQRVGDHAAGTLVVRRLAR